MIRSLLAKDQSSVKQIMEENSFQFPSFIINQYPERWSSYLSDLDHTAHHYSVAFDADSNVIGHAGYKLNPDTKLYEIVGVVVKKNQQSKGIGKALLQTICSQISLLGANKVTLCTLDHPENQATLAFYHKLGFQLILHEKDYYIANYHRVTLLLSL